MEIEHSEVLRIFCEDFKLQMIVRLCRENNYEIRVTLNVNWSLKEKSNYTVPPNLWHLYQFPSMTVGSKIELFHS
jgi:hypothetical protein